MEYTAPGFFIFYSIATGIFFLAQLYGFVISQTQYSESVEEPKFKMLKEEEKEWSASR